MFRRIPQHRYLAMLGGLFAIVFARSASRWVGDEELVHLARSLGVAWRNFFPNPSVAR